MIHIILKIISNAKSLVLKNIKNYAFLSVTIIISFSAIGIYMIYADSSIYNSYKEVMKVSSNIVLIEYKESDKDKIELLQNKLDKLENTNYYSSVEIQSMDLSSIWRVPNTSFHINIRIVPNYTWGYYYYTTRRLELIDGTKSLNVRDNEIIICESLYDIMKDRTDTDGNLYLKLPIKNEDRTERYYQFLVAGVCSDHMEYPEVYENEKGVIHGYFDIFMSSDCYGDTIYGEHEYKLTIHTEDVEMICQYAKDLNLQADSTLSEKEAMTEDIINSIEIRKMIILGLLFLLGINLFSCFSNAMNERKFEIGVRRATGASKVHIIMQFFVEGMIVMLADVLISLAVIVLVISCVKWYNIKFNHVQWIIRITDYSLSMFFISCIFLSLFFSVMFAIMSTRVEIVKYLKGE